MPPETQPAEILTEVAPDETPLPQPPGDSNYRPADVSGISCASCVKFNYTGVVEEDDGMVPVGTCDLYEASVRGDYVSDGYAEDTPPIDGEGEDDWEFADGQTTFNEVHLAATAQTEHKGLVSKAILRTGEWPVMPTASGKVDRPLKIVKSGKSDYDTGTISLEEVKANFDAKAIPNVQIPLSDDARDHKNITKLNTGFVRGLRIEETEDGEAELIADMDFTEPEIKEKVLRGTFADVSSGIPWNINARGKKWGTVLEHVCLTNRPFLELGPFMAASDEERAKEADVQHFGEAPADPEQPEPVSYERQRELIGQALIDQLNLSKDYEVADIEGDKAIVKHLVADSEWRVPFSITDGKAVLTRIDEWEESSEEEQTSAEQTQDEPAPVALSDIEYARRLRELRVSECNSEPTKEVKMPLSREELDRLELSDEQRAAFTDLLDDNADLRGKTREADADRRVEELKGLGLEERPGALKLYRQVMLADDGGPAVVLLSDSGQKESATALEVLDRFIEAIKGSDEKVELSDQHLVTDDDQKPPADASGETEVPFEERLSDAKKAIGQA